MADKFQAGGFGGLSPMKKSEQKKKLMGAIKSCQSLAHFA